MRTVPLESDELDSVRRRLLSVERLPTISTMFQKLVATIEDDRTTAKDLEKLVTLDQVITSRILKAVNSPFYGFNNVATLSRAIVLLGFAEIKNIALSASLMEVFNVKSNVGRFVVSDFWLHSMATAFIARYLARKAGIPSCEEFFTVGLLHDIGKVVFLKQEPLLFRSILDVAHEEGISLPEAEKRHGISHSLVGWFLLEKWNFPERVALAVKNHHDPKKDDAGFLEAAVIHISDYLAIHSRIGASGNPAPSKPLPRTLSALNLTPRILEELMEEMMTKAELIHDMGAQLLTED